MASESRDTEQVSVSVPADLQEWLDTQAAELGVDRETVLQQLLAAYHASEDLDGDRSLSAEDIEPLVRDVLTSRLPDLTDAVAEQVTEDLREELVADLRDQLGSATDDEAIADLRARIDTLEDDYQDKLADVRQRVIQVKRDAEHGDADIESRLADIEATVADLESAGTRIDRLAAKVERLSDRESDVEDRLDGLETELDGVESELAAVRSDLGDGEGVSALRDELSDAQEKLKTVAWVVRDLRDSLGGAASQALDDIKQDAAAADTTRASCENCGRGVEIGLLSEPSCPHCDATLAGFEPSKRRFGLGSATLTVAAGLEAGSHPDHDDELDDISTANRGDRR